LSTASIVVLEASPVHFNERDGGVQAYVTLTVDQELLARNEYLPAENRILKAQLKGRLKLSDAERATLGEIGASLLARR
jgi:hypothetical protein